jgi:hypothetical protein
MPRSGTMLVLLAVVATTISCDQVSKHVASTHLMDGPRQSYLGDALRLEYSENTGAFLSLGSGLPWWARTTLFSSGPGFLAEAIIHKLPRVRYTLLVPGARSRLSRLVNEGAEQMGYAVALILSLGLTGWAAQDAARRGRSWYGWSRLVFFTGIFGLIAWLVVRRRAPVTVERLGVLPSSLLALTGVPLLALAVLSSVFIVTFLLQVARIEGHAMEPTLQDQERVVVNRLVYRIPAVATPGVDAATCHPHVLVVRRALGGIRVRSRGSGPGSRIRPRSHRRDYHRRGWRGGSYPHASTPNSGDFHHWRSNSRCTGRRRWGRNLTRHHVRRRSG